MSAAAGVSRRIGDRTVWPVGLGCAFMSISDVVDEDRSLRAIHAALDAGVTVLDTARAYTTVDESAHNERLVARALAQRTASEEVLVVTKGGHFRADRTTWGVDGRPEALRRDCEASLRALGVEEIDLYLLHHPDPAVPVAESVGALDELRTRGLVRMIGVSNVDLGQLEQARRAARIDAVQNLFSPVDQAGLPVVEACAEAGIAYLAYSPLRGLAASSAQRLPRSLEVARREGISLQRLMLAWLLGRTTVLPLVGATREESARDSAAAATTALPEEAWAIVDAEILAGFDAVGT